MTDWRQIQARIRKAKAGLDAVPKLTQLFDKTRDGMVAFELALLAEKTERMEEAVHWYTTAAQRFRRTDWRKKAREALERLGAPVPPEQETATAEPPETKFELTSPEAATEPEPKPAEAPPETSPPAAAGDRRKRRRGRRGGRRHRRAKEGRPVAASAPVQAERGPERPATLPRTPEREERPSRTYEPPREAEEPSKPASAGIDRPLGPSWQATASRAGEPALASRMAKLEMLLRRLTTGPLHPIDELASAPAGPGVFIVSEADLSATYYVESCKTLRVALGNLTRTARVARGRDGEASVKSMLAEHLGISEAQATKYLKEHCVARWLQLDEHAAGLAHFAIAVLQPILISE